MFRISLPFRRPRRRLSCPRKPPACKMIGRPGRSVSPRQISRRSGSINREARCDLCLEKISRIVMPFVGFSAPGITFGGRCKIPAPFPLTHTAEGRHRTCPCHGLRFGCPVLWLGRRAPIAPIKKRHFPWFRASVSAALVGSSESAGFQRFCSAPSPGGRCAFGPGEIRPAVAVTWHAHAPTCAWLPQPAPLRGWSGGVSRSQRVP